MPCQRLVTAECKSSPGNCATVQDARVLSKATNTCHLLAATHKHNHNATLNLDTPYFLPW